MSSPPTNKFIIVRNTKTAGYSVWSFDLSNPQLLAPTGTDPDATLDPDHRIAPIGNYLMEWGPLDLDAYYPCFPYRLLPFDPNSKDPLGLDATTVQKGAWEKKKFWGWRPDFGNPTGGTQAFDVNKTLELIPFGNFMLNMIATEGRGTFELWNFDPNPLAPDTSDPLPAPYTPQGAFETIQEGCQLLTVSNYALVRELATGDYQLFSFDPQSKMPLARPQVARGSFVNITPEHQMTTVGEYLLAWVPGKADYKLWKFDPTASNPFESQVQTGTLPQAFDENTTFTGIETLIALDEDKAKIPGTIDSMRKRIKHVVYYMIENRSLDHVCGWLYEKGDDGVHIIGPDPETPYDGVSTDYWNWGYDDETKEPQKIHISKFEDGKVSEDFDLDFPVYDPYHDNSDVMRQMFHKDYAAYQAGEPANMGGFIWNNGDNTVMQTYTPEQLPILNGLAKHFSISDRWFCSMPGGTDVNRAYSLTGSALGKLNNFQNGTEYEDWPDNPHRPSIWKTLWSNGFTDWKIYNSVKWMDFVFTYNLFLDGQIPSVDADTSNYIASIDDFKKDALEGTLPKFSYLEPIWVAMSGTTSYHPGEDLVPGEDKLNEIYNALRKGPNWEETLLIITFDEHGGLYDHVPPPRAARAWPNDEMDEFKYDITGPRVPTIVVSPLVKEKTVFRSTTGVEYDATSFLATLLEWYGIPRSRWYLGERTAAAPTFEATLSLEKARTDDVVLTPPYDKTHPPGKASVGGKTQIHDLHRLMVPRVVHAIMRGQATSQEMRRTANDILGRARDLGGLTKMLDELRNQF